MSFINVNKLLSLLSIMGLSIGLTGCATSRVNTEELSKIKKIAIVGFTAYQPISASLSYDIGSGKIGAEKNGSVIAEKSKDVDPMIEVIGQGLTKSKGWKVLNTEAMKKNAVYIESYKATMEGWQNKMPAPAGVKTYGIDGVMDKEGVRILRPAGTNKLITALGVDAVAVVNVNTMLDSTTILGIGQRKPYTQLLIQVFSPSTPESIWFETFTSDVSKESVGATHFIDEDKVPALAMATLKNALSKIK
jgi:hypothetical protein